MNTHTVFTLLDGAKFDTITKAKEHCLEQMGAETRDMLQNILDTNSLYEVALNLVSEEKYDYAIQQYTVWREEHNNLINYEKDIDV